MRIFVVFTGGTIGSAESGGWISPDSGTSYRLLNGYRARFGEEVEFVVSNPYTVLSENLGARELSLLIGRLCDGAQGGYDGIIVAHGTDTLQYAAAAAAFCLGCDSIPVLFVSSRFPLGHRRSNGEINFEAAVEFIRAGAGRGVYVCYANGEEGAVDIHLAARLLRHPEFSDRVDSCSPPYGIYRGGRIEKNPDFASSAMGKPCGRVEFCDAPGLLTVSVSPTEEYGYDLSRYKAVLLLPYHSGTLNTANPRFEAFCLKAKALDIPVFLPDVPGGSPYESMRAYERLHITVLPGAASIAISVKIWLAVSLHTDIKRFVTTPVAQELNG